MTANTSRYTTGFYLYFTNANYFLLPQFLFLSILYPLPPPLSRYSSFLSILISTCRMRLLKGAVYVFSIVFLRVFLSLPPHYHLLSRPAGYSIRCSSRLLIQYTQAKKRGHRSTVQLNPRIQSSYSFTCSNSTTKKT